MNFQNAIKDAIKMTPGMEDTLEKLKKNAAILSRNKNERAAFHRICLDNGVDFALPPVSLNFSYICIGCPKKVPLSHKKFGLVP